jgi:hypothetical protein
MTARKHLKRVVRARMSKTGERYAAARRHVVRDASKPKADDATRWHFPGRVPATTALRVLLTHAGVHDPHTGAPFSEAMFFGIAGGIGIGACSFFYLKANFASFFLAGRHYWMDDLHYLTEAAKRFGLEPQVREATGAKAAEKHLREALAEGPCVAWVDAAHLPHRAMPAHCSGSGYHVVTVYRIDDGSALIGDLAERPIAIPLADLAVARARIKKFKNRLMTLPSSAAAPNLKELVRAGLAVCAKERVKSSFKGLGRAMQLDALRIWAERLHGSKDKEAWERIFAPGPNLWRGLTSIYGCVEHHGTGGGLCRPLFAEFLGEAAKALRDARLAALSARYAELGKRWSELAGSALPDAVPAFCEAKSLLDRKAKLLRGGGSAEEVRAVWARLDELARQAGEYSPLSGTQSAALRAELQNQVRALYEAEVSVCAAVAEAAA